MSYSPLLFFLFFPSSFLIIGDWGLRPFGIINLKDTDRITVSNALFRRTDSNAIFIGGRNRNATILNSECVWLGMNCVASLGETDQDDATGGEQPWGTVLSGVVAHELALFEKQSSAYFLGRTPLSRVENCIFYNGPRAMININDHLGGGNNFSSSLLFSTCRESGDHGAMNSWHRMPFLSDISSVSGASYYPMLSETSGVFGIGNYGAVSSRFFLDYSSLLLPLYLLFLYIVVSLCTALLILNVFVSRK